MELVHMADIIPLIGIPYPPGGSSSYYIPCPKCVDGPRKKHLNINLVKDVFRCPRCGFHGGVFDLYASYTGTDRSHVRKELLERLERAGSRIYDTPGYGAVTVEKKEPKIWQKIRTKIGTKIRIETFRVEGK